MLFSMCGLNEDIGCHEQPHSSIWGQITRSDAWHESTYTMDS